MIFKALLIIFGIVAVASTLGLVLIFTSQTTAPLAIGDSYGPQPGIVTPTPLPPYNPYVQTEYPAPLDYKTIGTRTPLLRFFPGGSFGSIYESAQCWGDLYPKITAPEDVFSCYVVPVKGVAEEVTGWYPPSSTALPKIPAGRLGGEVLCYERTPRDRQEMFNTLAPILLEKNWKIGNVNGLPTLDCYNSQYIFPQGLKY
jgi:hypothetical protein